MGKRGPRRQLTEDAICDAALAIVAADGLHALSVNGLARSLGTSPSGLYRYFDGKEAILVQLQHRAIANYEAQLGGALVQDRLFPPSKERRAKALSQIITAFGYYTRHAVEHPAEHRLIDDFLSAPRPMLSTDAAMDVEHRLSRVETICTQLLDEAVVVSALSPGDSRARTHLIWATLHGLDHFRKRDRFVPDHLQTPTLQALGFQTILSGFGAPSTPLSVALQAAYPAAEAAE